MTALLCRALTIAGSDSSGGAGIQADLKTFAALGVYGTSAITAVTAQNTLGIIAVEPLVADLVTAQIEAVAGDIELQATKTGMLATAAIVEAVTAAIDELDLPKVVVDPVIVATSGTPLLDDDGVQVLRAELFPRALVVTPNLPEAEILSGYPIRSMEDIQEAARRIHDLGPNAVLVTGGHGQGNVVIDVLYDGDRFVEFRTERLAGPKVHGTGCAFASAVAASLALGVSLEQAAEQAQRYVAGAIRQAFAVGHGRHILDHFWKGPGLAGSSYTDR
jgi:hydroxymethylpyrimidine/phosphomethylpyrimidine kinase